MLPQFRSQRPGLSLLCLLVMACGSSDPVALAPGAGSSIESLTAPDQLFSLSSADPATSLLTTPISAQLGTPYDEVARADRPGEFATTDFGRGDGS